MMTEFELLSMFNEYETIMQNSFMNFVTILFAFLIASFFVAARLNKRMSLVVVSVFTLASLQMGVTFILYYREQTGLVREFFPFINAHDDQRTQFRLFGP